VVTPPVVTPPIVPSCPTGQTLCSGQCIDLQTNPQSCGACGRVCAQGQTCVNGACTLVCPTGQVNCSGACVDVRTNAANCGACGKSCSSGQTCINSVCTTTQVATKNGQLVVYIEPIEARKAGAMWQGPGLPWFESGNQIRASVNSHQIIFKSVSGFQAPGAETALVKENQLTTIRVTYKPIQTTQPVPSGELVVNGFFEQKWNGWVPQIWAKPAGNTNDYLKMLTDVVTQVLFESPSGNTRYGIMQTLNKDVSGCRNLMLKTVVVSGKQTLPGTGYGGREAPVAVFAGYRDVNGVERTATPSMANPTEPQTNQMFWHGFYSVDPSGQSQKWRGSKVVMGQYHSEVFDLMQQNPKPQIIRFVGAEGAGWGPRTGAVYKISLVCNGDATPLSKPPVTSSVEATSGLLPLQPPSDPVIFSNGNIALVQNGPRMPTTFSVTNAYKLTWIYTYHYYNNGKLPGTITLRHSDGTLYGPFKAEGAVGQGHVPNAYWFVRPSVEIKPGSYQVIDSDSATWSHNSGSQYAGFVELRGIKVATQGASNGMQPLQPPNDPIIVDIGNIAAVQNGPRLPTTFTLNDSYLLTFMYNYHYFNNGVQPGTIALKHSDGTVYGPWQAQGAIGQGGVPNAYWFVRPSVLLKSGTYLVIDSHPATWSHNSGTQGAGFVRLWGVKQPLAAVSQGTAGVWDTSEGVLAFTQNGYAVAGSYSQDNGKIDGTINGAVLDGYWTESSSGQRCPTAHNGNYYWGKIHFVFSGNTFTGAWGYCTANPDHPWTGKKR